MAIEKLIIDSSVKSYDMTSRSIHIGTTSTCAIDSDGSDSLDVHETDSRIVMDLDLGTTLGIRRLAQC